MRMNKEGLLFIISAPSGAGKTSLCNEITRFLPDLQYSVSYTTRSPREGEKNGEDYHFISNEKFQEMIDERRFVEWAEVHGNRYGTAVDSLRECRHKGKDVILDIDGQGARQIKDEFPDAVCIYILPPSWKELEERLPSRRTDSDENIIRRLRNATEEVRYVDLYDYILINDDFNETVFLLKSIIAAERCRSERVLPLIEEFKQSL